jgi:very-short-patch-repair endonuclease
MKNRYNIVIDSRFKLNRERRWRCLKCNVVFYANWRDIIEEHGCKNCKLVQQLKEETLLLHKFAEIERKGRLTRYEMSYGETLVKDFLEDRAIPYEHEHVFPDFSNPFDFYVKELNLCIEFDGQQHVEPSKRQGGLSGLERRKYNDALRNNYCKKNGISLVRLSFLRDDDTNLRILEEAMIRIKTTGSVVFVSYEIKITDKDS